MNRPSRFLNSISRVAADVRRRKSQENTGHPPRYLGSYEFLNPCYDRPGRETKFSAFSLQPSAFLMNRPRILLADDHRMVAEGLKSLLSPEFELVGVVEDGLALHRSGEKACGLTSSSPTSPCRSSTALDALAQLKKEIPRVRVVFLTMHQDVAYARRALEAGASGFVLKHSAPAELVAAIRARSGGKNLSHPGAGRRSPPAHPARPEGGEAIPWRR